MQFQGFVNLTPFAAQPLLLSDERGADVLTFVVKGTFSIHANRDATSLAIADEQPPPCVAPKYNGEPGASSVKYDADTALVKLGTDVVLVGHAYPTHLGATSVDVSLTVGPARLAARVYGDRVWTSTLGRWMASTPQPFDAMPLVYERAFGGWDRRSPDPAHHDYEPRNPVGVGFVAKKHPTLQDGAPLPNIENPHEPISSPADRPTPVGFGFIGPHWQPRARYAGTYDDRWKEREMPLLPHDFDRRFYSAAHPALTFQGFLRGGEPVEILNASPRGALRFWLPTAQPFATVRMKDGSTHRIGMALDTIVVDADEDRLYLVWRGSFPVHKRVHDVLWAKAQLAADRGASA